MKDSNSSLSVVLCFFFLTWLLVHMWLSKGRGAGYPIHWLAKEKSCNFLSKYSGKIVVRSHLASWFTNDASLENSTSVAGSHWAVKCTHANTHSVPAGQQREKVKIHTSNASNKIICWPASSSWQTVLLDIIRLKSDTRSHHLRM